MDDDDLVRSMVAALPEIADLWFANRDLINASVVARAAILHDSHGREWALSRAEEALRRAEDTAQRAVDALLSKVSGT